MKRGNKREGFTLVELLIVIVVIGVLAAMMMLSSNEAVTSARAAKIISDMTQIKKAVNAWYLENYDRLGSGAGGIAEERGIMVNGKITRFSEFINGVGAKEMMKYISEGTSINIGSKSQRNTEDLYIIRATGKTKYWYVSYYLGNKSASLKEKIASRAKAAGLFGSTALNTDDKINTVYTNQAYVDMLVLEIN